MHIIELRFDGQDDDIPVSRYVAVDVADSGYQEFYDSLIDAFMSYIDHVFDPETDPTPYTNMVNAVMGACGHPWMPLTVDRITI